MVNALDAVKMASALIKKDAPATATKTAPVVMPTPKTRTALETLIRNDAVSLAGLRLDIRAFTTDLFGWSGKPRVTKPLMRKIGELLTDEVNYQKNIELISFAVAASRMLEPDRIVRLLSIPPADNVFSPARYTLQFAQKLEKVFGHYPDERKEHLLASLWEVAHKGRWWDVHLPKEVFAPEDVEENQDFVTVRDNFVAGELPYTRHNAGLLNMVGADDQILDAVAQFTDEFARGNYVDPDIAVFSSYLTWLPTNVRPESPVAPLLGTLVELAELIEYHWPKDATTFAEIFPQTQLYASHAFPFHMDILSIPNRYKAPTGHRVELIRSAGELAENATFMGNCTNTYRERLMKGTTFILRITDKDGNVYNAAAEAPNVGEQFHVREINSRFNRGNVPAIVREWFENLTRQLGRAKVAEDFEKIEEMNRRIREADGGAKRKYKVTLAS